MNYVREIKIKNNKGFTLIELLIVIAIIGILASIVLVSLNSARVKAQDASAFNSVESVGGFLNMCMVSGSTPPVASGTTVHAGDAICSGQTETYPALPGAWQWGSVWYESSTSYYWISASNGSKILNCQYATTGWGGAGAWNEGNKTHRCLKNF